MRRLLRLWKHIPKYYYPCPTPFLFLFLFFILEVLPAPLLPGNPLYTMQGARELLRDSRIELGEEVTFDSPAPSPLLPGVLQFLPFKRPPPQRAVFLEPNSTASNEFPVSRLPHLLYTVVVWLLPRFARRNGLQSTKKDHVTSYLDSLRGWAAVIVLSHHHHPWYVSSPY